MVALGLALGGAGCGGSSPSPSNSDAAGSGSGGGAADAKLGGGASPDGGPAPGASEAGQMAQPDAGMPDVPAMMPGMGMDMAPGMPASAAIRVSPSGGLFTSERGTQATFTVVLDGEPTADVTIAVSSSNDQEGTVSPKTLTFTPANARAPQTVTITGVDDKVKDGNIAYNVVLAPAVSADPRFGAQDAADVGVTNIDDETAGFSVVQTGILRTSEGGAQAKFAVVANSKPTANVTLPVISLDTSEGTAAPASLVFTPEDWDSPHVVTVTGVDDSDQDGDQEYVIGLGPSSSADMNYLGLMPPGPKVVNADNEAPGVVVAAGALRTTEAGGQATFTVALRTKPAAVVTIPVSSGDASEGSVTPTQLRFSPENWNAPQVVTVTGVDDDLSDGNQIYSVILGATSSPDPSYSGLDPDDVGVTNVDNETAGVTVAMTEMLKTTERGDEARFSVVLNSRPSANVTIGISSSDTDEGTVTPTSLVFTGDNWNAPQFVTVAGVNDDVADGDQAYLVVTAPAVSTDSAYGGIDGMDVPVLNVDDDSGGITVAAAENLTTTEAGASATFTVTLNSKPTANVTIGIASSDPSEGAVSPASLVFTADNWNAPQVVTAEGVNDDLIDGNQVYIIATAAAVSADPSYDGRDADDVEITNTDNDSAGITVRPVQDLTTTEVGATDTFTIVLNAQPKADVVIGISSSDTTEGTVSPASVTFSQGNWNAPRTVTVTGVDDDVDDGNQVYSILTAAAVSTDQDYSGVDAENVAVTNTDDDTAGITVDAVDDLATTEIGGTAEFTIVLNSQPTANVTIPVTSSDTSEGTVSPSALTFTSVNWNAPQTVTVAGVDDDLDDGNQPITIVSGLAVSSDPNYDDINAENVVLTNTDDDTAGITVGDISGDTSEAGATATFTVVLNSEPTANVTVGVSSNDTGEGTVSPASLTFTSVNWNAPQTVTVTGIDDDLDDGDQPFIIVTAAAVSSDVNYSGMNAANVDVTNTDNDTAGITVTGSPVSVGESGSTGTFTVVLNSEPTANVTIGLTSSDTGEGTVSPSAVTFTVLNWAAPQTVTVTGVNDDLDDGDQPFFIVTGAAVSSDTTGYAGMDASNVDVTNNDNDTAGITVSTISGSTTEAGGTSTFTIVLDSEPTANVTIGLTSSDTGEGTVSPSAVTFTALNWAAPQTVTVTGIDDALADGDQPFTIVTAAAVSGDTTGYSGMNAANVDVQNDDNDAAGITVSTISGQTTEAGGTATFTVVLDSEPEANVTIGLTSSDTGEGTISPSAVTFTALNWNAPQTVTVTGVNDDIADGDQPFSVVTAAAVSTDTTGYSGMDASNVSVTNNDNDTAGITVSTISGQTSEAGGTATFTIVLDSQPTGNVTIGLTSNDTGEGTVAPAAVTFTSVNWAAPQTVTVTGVNDDVADGDQPFNIVTAAATGSDATGYVGMDASDVSVQNNDNDSAGITVGTISGQTTEAGATATFTVVLDSEPTANVTIGLSSNDTGEGTVTPASLTFTSVNWAAPQTVTVTGVDDDLDDGDQPFSIVTAAAVSSDTTGYSGLDANNVSVTNNDNDSAGITVSTISGVTTEAGVDATFTVVLDSEPTANVTIGLTSNDTGEGTVSPASLTFTSVNWAAPQTVTVTGVNDDLADGDQPFSIVTAAAVSSDTTGYSGLDANNVSVTNNDNDSAGITVSTISGATTEGGGDATFTVVLDSEPTANVTIGLTSNDTGEGTVSPASLTFTSVNWAAPQTVTVTGVNDDLDDGDQPFSILTAAAVSTDSTGYSGLDANNVSVTNGDNDTAGITVDALPLPHTTEAGGTGSFTVVLDSEPTANVTIDLSSNDTGEGTMSPASLTFTPLNWNAPRTVTVTGVDDDLNDGDQPFHIMTAAAVSSDLAYSGLDAYNVGFTNDDNDSAGITVSTVTGGAGEDGSTATFTVVLDSEPTASVTIDLSSSDTGEGTVSPASLTFTSVSWSSPQTVTVTGVNDDVADGDQPFTIVTAAAVSTDMSGYSGLDASNVSLTNEDNDSAGISVGTISGHTGEAGGTAEFTVVLDSEPTAAVTIDLSSSDTNEGTVSPASVTFTTLNWATPQTVTVTGVDDAIDDGDQPFTITTAAAVSSDTTGYSALNPPNVSVTNDDDDSAGFTVSSISGHVSETGTSQTFTIVLNTQPTADVTVGLTSNDTGEGTVGVAAVTFTDINWSTPQTVSVTGVDDAIDDGDQSFSIVTAGATSDDSNYSGRNGSDVSVTNDDDDDAGITVGSISGHTTEAGGTASFTIVLDTQPTADVTIDLASSNTDEGTVAPADVTFTSMNWSTPQSVVVTGVDDAVDDGDVGYSILTGAAISSDGSYNSLAVNDVSVTNDDDDETPTIRLFSAGTHNGNFVNRATADALCTSAASGWAVGKTIHAFISFDGVDHIAGMPTNHGMPSDRAFYDLTGTNKIADDLADVTGAAFDMSLGAAGVLTSGEFWWSGATWYGTYHGNGCSNFTDGTSGAVGVRGISDSTNMVLGSGLGYSCDNLYHLLCAAW